jgi:hypothetical protein
MKATSKAAKKVMMRNIKHEEIKRLECSKRYVAASYERNGMYRFHMVGVST